MLNATAASFDCSQAPASFMNKTICSDPMLSKLDSEVAQLYKELFDMSSDKNNLLEKSLNWTKKINVCSDKKCLVENYQERKLELETLLRKEKQK